MKNLILFLACIISLIGGFSGAQAQYSVPSHPFDEMVRLYDITKERDEGWNFPNPIRSKPDSSVFERFFSRTSMTQNPMSWGTRFGMKFMRDSNERVNLVRVWQIDSNSSQSFSGSIQVQFDSLFNFIRVIDFIDSNSTNPLKYKMTQNFDTSLTVFTSVQILDSNSNLIVGDSLEFHWSPTNLDSVVWLQVRSNNPNVWVKYQLFSNFSFSPTSFQIDKYDCSIYQQTTNQWEPVESISNVVWSPNHFFFDRFLFRNIVCDSLDEFLKQSFWNYPKPTVFTNASSISIGNDEMLSCTRSDPFNPSNSIEHVWMKNSSGLPTETFIYPSQSTPIFPNYEFDWQMGSSGPLLQKIQNGTNFEWEFLYNSNSHLIEESTNNGRRLYGYRYNYTYLPNSSTISSWCQVKDNFTHNITDTILKVNLFYVPQLLTGIKNQDSISVRIFPNPCTEWLEIENKNEIPSKLKIQSCSGNQILSIEITPNSSTKISTENWIPGLYLGLLQLQNGENKVIKIIKR